jgi:Ca-activated chloride channel homolog
MDLLWPGFLILLGIIPLIVGIYIWNMRRKKAAVRYSSLAILHEALPRQSRLRRHLPFSLFVIALASMIIALSRPVSIVSIPTGQIAVVLAVDVSLSMCAVDIPPNRLTAAEEAMLAFIEKQPPGTEIGIVAFAGFAELIQPPTNDPELLQDTIESLLPGRRTAIGSAILRSLDTIAEIDPAVAPIFVGGAVNDPTPVPNGAYAPEIVVLLTDGASNTGPDPLIAAEFAANRGVRVYTIGFGSDDESSPFGGRRCEDIGQFFGGRIFGGGGGGFRRGIDEPTLINIADITGGTYYSAESANELQDVFQSLPTHLITRHETTEISVFFVAIAALLTALALLLALIWHPLP